MQKRNGVKKNKKVEEDRKWEERGGRKWDDGDRIIMVFLCEGMDWVQSDVNNLSHEFIPHYD